MNTKSEMKRLAHGRPSEIIEENLMLRNRLRRTVHAAEHALLEMSAFLGIPEKKRLNQVKNLMENVRFCADNDEGSST